MPHLHHVALGSCEGVLSLALLATALVYMRGWLRLRSRPSRAIALRRAGSFLLGLFLIWIAVGSPVAALDHELLTVHMIQHLLLMTFAPPLIWLGKPSLPVLAGLPLRLVEAVLRLVSRQTALKRLGDALTRPSISWSAAAGVLVLWHIPAALALGLRSEAWHFIEHASFLVAGLLFWRPVVCPSKSARWPEFSIILYLFFATLPCDVLAGLLVFGDRVVYSAYGDYRPFGLSAMADQQSAGALMWTCVTVVYLVAGGIVTMRLLSPRHRQEEAWAVVESRDGAHQELPQAMEV